MLIAWSGHRPEVFLDALRAEAEIDVLADELARQDVEFVCGGQRGVDQWAAAAALKRGLPYHLVLPSASRNFSRDWQPDDRAFLERLTMAAASVDTIANRRYAAPLAYDLRNEEIVRRADLLVVVWTGLRRGGTFQTMCAAQAMGVPIRELLLERSTGDNFLSGRGV